MSSQRIDQIIPGQSLQEEEYQTLPLASGLVKCGGGVGGFFLACEDLGRMFDHSFPACASFFYVYFFEVEISSRTLIPLFMPGSVQWLTELRRL